MLVKSEYAKLLTARYNNATAPTTSDKWPAKARDKPPGGLTTQDTIPMIPIFPERTT